MAYTHIFFDLDHTIWDFDTNSRHTLEELYTKLDLPSKGVHDFELFLEKYLYHNNRLWERYHKGHIKQSELRTKRMWLTLLEFKIGDPKLAQDLSEQFLIGLPTRKQLFPDTITVLDYLKNKNYELHLITNGFDKVQHSKLQHAAISTYFGEVITSERSNSLKPAKEIFDYALQLTGATATSSIMIGDNIEADIKGAHNAGIDQIHMNHTKITTDFKATYTVYELKELYNIL